jgi:transposase-like protein
VEKRTKRSYSDREKAAALLAVEANRFNFAQTARDTGIPDRTLRDWFEQRCGFNEDIARIRDEQREPLADAFERIARKCTQRLLNSTLIEDCKSPVQVGTVAAIATDKAQLLRGKATQISGIDDTKWPEIAANLAKKYGKSLEEVKQDLVRERPELASVLVQ